MGAFSFPIPNILKLKPYPQITAEINELVNQVRKIGPDEAKRPVSGLADVCCRMNRMEADGANPTRE